MQRYFISTPYKKDEIRLSGEAFHHMIRVMRMKPEDEVYLVYADQIAIIAKIVAIEEDAVILTEVEKERQNKELPLLVTIASGYPKGDKLEWIVQKGTELGAYEFIGFPAQSSVVKWDEKKLAKKKQRLVKIAQEAAEQSQRQLTPNVELLANEGQLWDKLDAYDAIVVAYEESAKQGEKAQLVQVLQSLPAGSRLLAIFGPEGGITPDEIEKLKAGGGKLCGLGPRILRTETAPLYLLSAISYQWELL
ncbi:16S rRNA (uracil(1498)-N(3))-methyltransferase [Enterococcus dispar]|jgi:16S rRNA (uracil1498-N3)-methyltransferase|uniref:16S rRNA (uracil(1498)-N(3))-methyltransferase n=1 Tax=Enterococcus dispar TaxID=44009 RepID=UPI00189CB693|nr:16S rRNA (uracil(1498)-N(3))-methyltransferase [Enterococcus dispar]WCG34225.1 16S rRNA (uracil(1498)-N(3))-methyltransferase [Enterococcus dispar]